MMQGEADYRKCSELPSSKGHQQHTNKHPPRLFPFFNDLGSKRGIYRRSDWLEGND